jgi:hypothetical protein
MMTSCNPIIKTHFDTDKTRESKTRFLDRVVLL